MHPRRLILRLLLPRIPLRRMILLPPLPLLLVILSAGLALGAAAGVGALATLDAGLLAVGADLLVIVLLFLAALVHAELLLHLVGGGRHG